MALFEELNFKTDSTKLSSIKISTIDREYIKNIKQNVDGLLLETEKKKAGKAKSVKAKKNEDIIV